MEGLLLILFAIAIFVFLNRRQKPIHFLLNVVHRTSKIQPCANELVQCPYTPGSASQTPAGPTPQVHKGVCHLSI